MRIDMEKFKRIEHKVEDLDEQKGQVAIVINKTGMIDDDGDISAPGSFNKTIKENFRRIKHFLNHDRWILLGLPQEIIIKDDRVIAISNMNMKKDIAKDVFEDYKFFAEHNRTLEHSIGFEVIKRDKTDRRIILEYKLWEYSTLTSWGANEETPLLYLKDTNNLAQRIDALEKMYRMHYTPERMRKIEKALEALTNGQVKFDDPTVTKPQPNLAKILEGLDDTLGI